MKKNNSKSMFYSITKEGLASFRYWLVFNLRFFSTIVICVLPYAMFILGQYLYKMRGMFAAGGEIFLPVIAILLVYYMNGCSDRKGKGNTFPIASKRFTEVHDDGEVTIKKEELEEIILYLADVEDYLERKGRLKTK